ncbi:MAG: hypothetical protein WAM97_10520 [Acidimicrobiales bacterium]
MDKVKAQATQLAEKAQEAGKAGQAKIEGFQTKKQSDTLLRDLGAYTFATERGRADNQTPTKIAGVIAQLDAFEAQNGPIDLSPDPGVNATTDAAGGMAPPVANVPQGSVVNVNAQDPNAAPIYTGGGIPTSNVGVPAANVGAPSGNVGGIPSGNVGGGIPSGNVGGIPSGNVGGIPSDNVGGVPEASVGDTPAS